MADDLVVRIDVQSAAAMAATNDYGKALQKVDANLSRAAAAQAKYDAAVASSGANSEKAAAAQMRLGSALAKTTEAEQRAAVAAARAGEIQAAASAKASAAAEKSAAAQTAANEKVAVAQKRSASSALAAATGFSAQTIGVLALGAAFVYAVKSSADFESKMAQIKVLTGGSAAQVSALANATKQFAGIGISASQAADAEIELVKAGVSVKDILGGGLTGALNLAAAGQMNVADATSIASASMVQFGLSGKDIPHIADLLAAGANKSLGSVQDLGMGLKAVGTTAHQAGFSIEETVGGLAALASAGLTAELGGTALKQMFLKLEAPSAKAKTLMDQYGISLYDAAGNIKPLSAIAGELKDHLSQLTPATRNAALATIFGSRAVQAANVLYQQGAAGIQNWTSKVNDQGAAARTTSGQMDSLNGDLQKLVANFKNLATAQGEGSQSSLRQLAQDANSAIPVLGGLNSAFTKLTSLDIGRFTQMLNPLGGALHAIGSAGDVFGADALPPGFRDQVRQMQEFAAAQQRAASAGAVGGGAAMGGSIDELGNSYASLAPKASAAAGATKDLSGAQKDASGSAQALFSAENALNSVFADRLNSQAALTLAIESSAAATKKLHGATTTATGAINLQSHAGATLVQSLTGIAAVASKVTGTQKEQMAAVARGRAAIIAQAEAAGVSATQSAILADRILEVTHAANTIPSHKSISVTANTAQALAELNYLKGTLDRIQSKTVFVNVVGGVGPGMGINGATGGPGNPFNMAEGGPIRGGTPGKDSVLRNLMPDEHIWTTREVKAVGGHAAMFALRGAALSGRLSVPGMAAGGAVRSPGGSGQTVIVQQAPFPEKVTLNIDAKAFKQMIRGESQVVVEANARWASR